MTEPRVTAYGRQAIIEWLAKEEDDRVREAELRVVARFAEGDHVMWVEGVGDARGADARRAYVGEVVDVAVLGFPDSPDKARIGYEVDVFGDDGPSRFVFEEGLRSAS